MLYLRNSTYNDCILTFAFYCLFLLRCLNFLTAKQKNNKITQTRLRHSFGMFLNFYSAGRVAQHGYYLPK